jgi:hypothetical protein
VSNGVQYQAIFLACNHPDTLPYVNILRLHSVGQLPVEVIQKARQGKIDVGHAKVYAGTHTTTSSEGEVLKVGPFVVQVVLLEPFGLELLRVIPVLGVPGNRPYIDEHGRPLWDVVAHDLARLPCLAREKERERWVQPQGLLYHQPEVAELCPGDVVLGQGGLPFESLSHLGLHLGHDSWGPDQLRHAPVQSDRRGITARSKQILKKW